MKTIEKEELIIAIQEISKQGWHQSVKKTIDIRNDGAVGNTLEVLLGIEENNLPIPNTREWELKGQRLHTKSLITLKHKEPSPMAIGFIANIFLPQYGWKHKEAGKKYPPSEMSFRSTTSATNYTNRGFKIIIDRDQQKIRFVFDATKADTKNLTIRTWLHDVERKIGLGPLDPEPYWGFEDIKNELGGKLLNCFYIVADTRKEAKQEYFNFCKLLILSNFSFDRLLECFEDGSAYIDFDARTGHNHGTKFRLKQERLPYLYSNTREVPL